MESNQNNEITWKRLLHEALTEPGKMSEAYRAFHDYSSGNQMLALIECAVREIQPGPISTYPGWAAKGRHVKKGEKAIALWMPINGKRTVRKTDNQGNEVEEEIPYTRFVLKNSWFVLSQTEGHDYKLEPIPGWDKTRALNKLQITEVESQRQTAMCRDTLCRAVSWP